MITNRDEIETENVLFDSVSRFGRPPYRAAEPPANRAAQEPPTETSTTLWHVGSGGMTRPIPLKGKGPGGDLRALSLVLRSFWSVRYMAFGAGVQPENVIPVDVLSYTQLPEAVVTFVKLLLLVW